VYNTDGPSSDLFNWALWLSQLILRQLIYDDAHLMGDQQGTQSNREKHKQTSMLQAGFEFAMPLHW
jgi:hypothetical protein